MLTKTHVTQRLHDLKAREEAGELPAWLGKVLRKGVRVAYKAEARERKAARRKVQTAREKGEIERPGYCERCGAEGPVEAHHPDHNEALEVQWLCRRCHTALDREVGMGLTHRRSKAVALRENPVVRQARLNREYGEMTVGQLALAELEAVRKRIHGEGNTAPEPLYIWLAVVGAEIPAGPTLATQEIAA